MRLLPEFFRYHAWATQRLIENCMEQPPAALDEMVVGTERNILHTLTHIIGTEEGYLKDLTGEQSVAPIRAGEILALDELRRRSGDLSLRWEALLDWLDQIDVTLPADGSYPATPHGQDLLALQTIQHGIDHRTQICTTLSVLGLEPPEIDVWVYWAATR